ncbi:MAG TPA: peptidylprolyl isomerase [Deltaproteobacteria bacterium]|nr:peptidylprolyl isomerase [Deltaproteobacteria bacterium]
MAQAKTGDTVSVHYTGTLDDGTVFDSSHERDPLRFTLGNGEVIQGFEDAVLGMEEGETRTRRIACDDAYGPRIEDLVFRVDKSKLPPDLDPEVGQFLQVSQEDGRTISVRVTEVTDADIALDANHPLAGKDLTFEIRLVSVL